MLHSWIRLQVGRFGPLWYNSLDFEYLMIYILDLDKCPFHSLSMYMLIMNISLPNHLSLEHDTFISYKFNAHITLSSSMLDIDLCKAIIQQSSISN